LGQKLGQHFLCSLDVVEAILKHSNLSSNDRVLEIGPGRGILTIPMSMKAKSLIAYEVDAELAAKLETQNLPNFQLRLVDFLKVDLAKELEFTGPENFEPYKVIANLPYYITSPILEKLLQAPVGMFSDLVLMMQHEVAQRIVSPGKRECGSLSYFCHYYSQPTYLFKVAPDSFSPPPEVQSAVVHFKMRSQPLVENGALFFRLVRTAFWARRKMLKGSLSGLVTAEQFAKANIDPTRRPETLSVDEFVALVGAVSSR
jgi:16S rRNA (adenine1518-N6/adenine1519-N6)-dimethyltransferase